MKKSAKSFGLKGALLSLSLVLPFSSFAATGTAGGGGGDTRCQEFFALVSEISVDFIKIGQAEVSKVNPLIDVTKIRAQVMHPLQVIPKSNLPRQALSFPKDDLTQLDVYAWSNLPDSKKVKLAIHELMVLTGAEIDGQYSVSQDAQQILYHAGFFKEAYLALIYGDNTVMRDDGSVVIHVQGNFCPSDNKTCEMDTSKATFISLETPGVGLCKRLKFNEFVARSFVRINNIYKAVLIFDENSNLVSTVGTYDNADYYDTITCKK